MRALENRSQAWKRARRPLGWTLLVVLAVAASYEVAVNVYIQTGGLARTLSSDPDTLLVQYTRAWMVVPGHVHARQLRIRSKDGHVELDLVIDRCTFRVVLRDLLRRRFHATYVDGDGVALRVRRRLDPAEATKPTIEALPPIDGLEAVPLKGPEEPPPDDAHYKLWTVDLHRVDARSVREIWIDEVRFAGDAHAYGDSFYLRPIRWVAVGPAFTEFRSGRVTTGSDVVAGTVTGRLDAAVDGFDPRDTHGAEVLHHVTAHVSGEEQFPSLVFVNRWIESPTVHLRGGGGRAKIDARIDHGRLVSPGHVSMEAEGLDADLDRRWIDGNMRASASVAVESATDTLDALIEGRHMRLFERAAEKAPLRAERAEVSMRATKLDLAERFGDDAAVSARVPVVDIPDARIANAWLPDDGNIRVDRGLGTAGGEVDMSGGTARGGGTLGLDGLRLVVGGRNVSGNVRGRVVLRSWSLAGGAIDIGGSHVDVLDVTTPDTSHWWGRAELPASTITTRKGILWRAHVDATARDARPFLKPVAGLPDWATGFFSTDGLRASCDVRVAPDSADVKDLGVLAGAFRVEGEWAKRGDKTHALVLIETGPLAVGVDSEDGRTQVQLLGARDWFKQRLNRAAAERMAR